MVTSCSPKISTSVSKQYNVLDYKEDVLVFGLEDDEPYYSERLGTVKIGDTGFTTNCNFETVIEKAKMEARKIGGNAIKIIKHDLPNPWTSSCHRITAAILKIDNPKDYQVTTTTLSNSLLDADYALLHVYRTGGTGVLVNYDLHLDDEVICRVNNNWSESIEIIEEGLYTLWARTESTTEIPINIKFGHEYYIRCGISMGFFVGHPVIEIVNNKTGKLEFQSITQKRNQKKK
jgi:hypothetical protein